LIPCDVLARVAPSAHQAGSEFEVEVARRLAETGGPVAELEPRVEHRVNVGVVHHVALAPRRPAARWALLENGGAQPGPGRARSLRTELGLTGAGPETLSNAWA